MLKETTSGETVVVATYTNWNDAEIARSFLEDEGIDSFIIGHQPHPSVELTDGARLRVLAASAERALDALRGADLLPSEAQSQEERKLAQSTYKRLVSLMVIVMVGLLILGVLFFWS